MPLLRANWGFDSLMERQVKAGNGQQKQLAVTCFFYFRYRKKGYRKTMKKFKYITFILLQSLVYGVGNPLTKVAYGSITPFWLLTVRFAMAFFIFMIFYGKSIVRQVRTVRRSLWLPSSLCCAGAYISCNVALSLTSATNVGFIMSLPVLFAPVLSVLVFRKKYEFRKLPVQLLMIVGLFLLCCSGGTFSFGAGEFLALLDAVFLAGVLVFGERAMQEMDVITVTALQTGVTCGLSFAGALLFDDLAVLGRIQPEAWMVAVYLAVFCTVIAYLLQNEAVKHLSASTVSMIQCTQPILTAAVAYVLLKEHLSGPGLLGAALIIGCLLIDGLPSGSSGKQ